MAGGLVLLVHFLSMFLYWGMFSPITDLSSLSETETIFFPRGRVVTMVGHFGKMSSGYFFSIFYNMDLDTTRAGIKPMTEYYIQE